MMLCLISVLPIPLRYVMLLVIISSTFCCAMGCHAAHISLPIAAIYVMLLLLSV